MHKEREIDVAYLARVEGEGAMYLKLVDDQVADLKFKIFEPPRFFEALLQGRRFSEAPDITARICGICPIAYQTSSCNAMEDAAGVSLPDALHDLRRLIYCGEWIESHGLHIYFLHAPDFLGYVSGIAMAAEFPERVAAGLRLKKVGNDLMALLGGREIHPINYRVGGFYRVPKRSELEALEQDLRWGLEAARDTVRWVSGFPFPQFERDYEFVALHTPDEYAIHRGRIVSNRGLDISPREWPDVFEEEHVEWSNALHARVKGRGAYHVGPLARYSLNYEQLTPLAREEAERAGLGATCRNPFQSIVVRAVELVVAFEEALRIIDGYERPSQPAVPVEPRNATGHGVSEAPRGLLYHRYEIDGAGHIQSAQIVPPTSQNQLSIEEDLKRYVEGRAQLPDDELQSQLEQAIRNYDPCISCATHFLDLEVDRA
ncbi:MAG TPA: Ni/Fe hydrogenase subunit alpha [Acidimicrobiia bacterium]|nr:Ni/Fe hydrogenase subunit alpha [Acidimicrobiia bacterium]